MSREVDKQKINDFINIYGEILGLDKNKHKLYFDFLKESIYRRALKYKDMRVPVSIDNYQNYVIKPKNNEWTIEDFLLNRLFVSMRQFEIGDSTSVNEGILADYIGSFGELSYNFDSIFNANRGFHMTDKEIFDSSFKTFSHEIGHALKSQYCGGYKYHTFRNDDKKNNLYVELIKRLKQLDNGRYKEEIIDQLVDDDKEMELDKTGVRGRKNGYCYSKEMFNTTLVDEMLNEDETIDLSNKVTLQRYTRIYEKDGKTKSGFYLDVPNVSSGYSKFYGIGVQLKYLLGKNNYFKIQYGNSDEVIENLDRNYQDISNEMFGENKFTPFQVIYLNNLSISKSGRTSKCFLETNEFLTRCYEKRLKKYLEHNKYDIETLDRILTEIDEMTKYTTHHVDKNIDKTLKHLVIYNSLRELVLEKQKKLEISSMLKGELTTLDNSKYQHK